MLLAAPSVVGHIVCSQIPVEEPHQASVEPAAAPLVSVSFIYAPFQVCLQFSLISTPRAYSAHCKHTDCHFKAELALWLLASSLSSVALGDLLFSHPFYSLRPGSAPVGI